MPTIQDLQMLQALPLDVKILKTKQRIKEWVEHYGVDGVYVSFSGGKDSTVLLDIARELYPEIKGVFVNTGLEYPEIVKFVKTFENIDIIRPKMSFKQVVEKYGYPFISKEVSECVQGARKYLTKIIEETESLQTDRQTDRQIPYHYQFDKLMGYGVYATPARVGGGTTQSIENSEGLASILNERMLKRRGGNNQRLAIMLGWLTKDKKNPIAVNIPEKDKSQFSQERYKFFLYAPFEISNKCCNVMKKAPVHEYSNKTKRVGITAQMASESRLRTQKWLQNGCNAFDNKNPVSNPMSFWSENDVLLYIASKNLKIASVYGDIVKDYEGMGQVEGQMGLGDLSTEFGIFDKETPLLKTTGCNRTGCMFCGFGCHLEKGKGRFERLKETHPKVYEFIMKPESEGGLGYKEKIDWINKEGGFDIKY